MYIYIYICIIYMYIIYTFLSDTCKDVTQEGQFI